MIDRIIISYHLIVLLEIPPAAGYASARLPPPTIPSLVSASAQAPSKTYIISA